METNKNFNLRQVLECYFNEHINIINNYEIQFNLLMEFLDNKYKLSEIYDFDKVIVKDDKYHNKFYKFIYNMEDEKKEFSTTIYVFFVVKDLVDEDIHNTGIVFDEIIIGEKDYPHGKSSLYMLDGITEYNSFDYNNDDDMIKNDNFLKKLIKK